MPPNATCAPCCLIDVHTKRPLAEWSINDLDDGLRDSTYMGVVGHDSGEGFLDSESKQARAPTCYGTRRKWIFRDYLPFLPRSSPRPVVRREHAGHTASKIAAIEHFRISSPPFRSGNSENYCPTSGNT